MTEYVIRQEEAYHMADEDDPRGRIEVDEDEIVLDAEWRGANRVVVAIASPDYRCGVNGCSRTVDAANEICWQHQDDSEDEDE